MYLTVECSEGDAVCLGESTGTASATASGGTGVISYLWSTGETTTEISGLEVGVYTVVVTDEAGCTATCSVTIGSVPAPLVDIACDADPLLSLGGSNSVANATGCNNLDYAFWSSSLLNAYGVDPHWSIVGGSFVENLSGSAIFTGSFVNNDDSNLSFDFNVVFGGRTYSPPAGSPKETGGPP